MYSGEVEWRSSEGILIQFEDRGETNATANSLKVSALVPGTTYTFKVSAISQSGRGAEAVVDAQTEPSQGTSILFTAFCNFLTSFCVFSYRGSGLFPASNGPN